MPNRCNSKVVAKYIGCYLGRPVIATSRIANYNGVNVTFHYNRHEDEKLIIETFPVMEFIQRLIQHILEKHFKQIRYYGLYSRHRGQDKKLNLAIAKKGTSFFPSIAGAIAFYLLLDMIPLNVLVVDSVCSS